DEEPSFSACPWRLWQIQEEMEEWHEDLRILYVACTRAQDYLVLSAALPEPFRPRSTWPLLLAERFDLRSGAFLADPRGEPVPRVRVVTDLDGTESGRASPSAVPAPEHGPSDPLEVVAAGPVRLAGKRVFEVSEIERYWRREQGLFGEWSWTAEDFAAQFDAEDGSDRKVWGRECPAQSALLDVALARQDRLLRAVLERWDCRES